MATIAGTAFDDDVRGTGDWDVFQMEQGGNDTVNAAGGDDSISFGGALTADDRINGGAGSDGVIIQGDYTLALGNRTLKNVETLVVSDGFSYDITAADDNVASGANLWVLGAQLTGADRLVFDGSRETDGTFTFSGGEGDDVFTGGANSDSFRGGFGADTLLGGGGSDGFTYQLAADSSGAAYDTIVGFNTAEDTINLIGGMPPVEAIDELSSGGLRKRHFDDSLGEVVTDAAMPDAHALLLTPTQQGLSKFVFLVIDANGTAGYQSGQDLVIAFKNPVGIVDFDMDNI